MSGNFKGGFLPTPTDTAANRIRNARILEMRAQKMTLQAIADEFGLTKSGVFRICDKLTSAMEHEAVDEMRTAWAGRLEMLWEIALERAIDGDEKALMGALRIADRTIRLFGLDAPVKVNVEVTEGMRAQIAEYDQKLRALPALDTNTG